MALPLRNMLIINDEGIIGGGTEQRIAQLAEYLLEQGHAQNIHILHSTDAAERQQQSPLFKHYIDRLFLHSCPQGHLASFRFTRRLLRQYSFDLIQGHNMMALTPMPMLAAHFYGLPTLFFAHDFWPLCAKRNFIDPYTASEKPLCEKASLGLNQSCKTCTSWKGLQKLRFWRWILNHLDAGICSGKTMQRLFENDHVLKGKWTIVTPWIKDVYLLTAQKKQKRDDKTLVFVGSLIDFKGAWVAAAALQKIIQVEPTTKLLFVGGEQEKDSLYKKKIERILTQDNTIPFVSFLGKKNQDEVRDILQRATLYLCPTVCFEGFGLNWAEAMAVGCPVIASDIGSIPDYVQHRITGFLVPPRDSDALAAAVVSLLSNKKKRNALGKIGMQYAQEHFQLQKNIHQLLKIYESLLINKQQMSVK